MWAIVLFIPTATSPETELIDKILLLGVLVIVPLGLTLVPGSDEIGKYALPYRLAILLQPLGAAAVVVSFFLEPGKKAALLAAVWLVVTAFIALYGLQRLSLPSLLTIEEVSITVGLIYISVGGGWLVMSRFGFQPLGFGDTIVLLTAVHFHFAGFAAPLLTGLAGRRLGEKIRSARRLFTLVAIAVTISTPLVATGITLSPLLALVGALMISLGLGLLAVLVIRWVIPLVASRLARALLLVSSVSSLIAMILASLYAYSIVTKTLIVDIPHMAMGHGIMNAFGFSLCGFLAWAIVRPE